MGRERWVLLGPRLRKSGAARNPGDGTRQLVQARIRIRIGKAAPGQGRGNSPK